MNSLTILDKNHLIVIEMVSIPIQYRIIDVPTSDITKVPKKGRSFNSFIFTILTMNINNITISRYIIHTYMT